MVIDVEGGNFDVKDGGVALLNVSATKISGSAVSTGSFGYVQVAGSGSNSGIHLSKLCGTNVRIGKLYIDAINHDTSAEYLTLESEGDRSIDIRSQGQIRFFTDDANTHRVNINANGRVGIGTDNPDGDLDVRGSLGYVYFTTGIAGAGQAQNLIFRSGSVAETWIGQIEFSGNANGSSQIVTRNTANLKFGTNNTVAMTISGSGQNVGIGNANAGTPEVPLHVKCSGAGAGLRIEGSFGNYGKWDLAVEADNADRFAISGNNLEIMSFLNDGKVGIGTTAPTSQLHVVSSSASRIVRFQNLGNHADYGGINVSTGTNDQSGTNIYLECDDGDGQGAGVIENASGTFQLRDTSDYRLKDNIRDTAITGSDIINSIKVRDFEWKKSGTEVTAGLVAQELTSSFAQAVSSGSADKVLGYSVLGISKERLVPVLVKALQESMTRIQTLETQMAQVSGSL